MSSHGSIETHFTEKNLALFLPKQILESGHFEGTRIRLERLCQLQHKGCASAAQVKSFYYFQKSF